MAKIMDLPEVKLISGRPRERAIEHILNVLDYDNFICRCIKERVNLETGSIFSVLPPGIDVESINDFAQGYGRGTDYSLPTRVIQTLKAHPKAVAIFDDVMTDVDDSLSQDFVISNTGEIYRIINSENSTRDGIEKLITETGVSWHFLCAIVEPDKNIDVKDSINQSNCETLRNILEIVVGAFDGEGYIHWSLSSG
jgi:hypothetical protein